MDKARPVVLRVARLGSARQKGFLAMCHLAPTARQGARVVAAALALSVVALIVNGGRALAALGDVTVYIIPTASAQPDSITAGPDGNVWFTEGSTTKIGNVTPSGSFTEYSLPNGVFGSAAITSLPDGKLWFTAALSTVPVTVALVSVTTSGIFSVYPTGTVFGANSLTLGPDGRIWFSSYGKVGNVTTSGVVTEYPDPADLNLDIDRDGIWRAQLERARNQPS